MKTIKQYALESSNKNYKELLSISKQYRNVKNYVYSRYSGISSYLIIHDKYEIRNGWTKNGFIDNWGISRRYTRYALLDAISNIKVSWNQCLTQTRKDINKILQNDKDKHFAYIMLKNKQFLFNILNGIKFDKIDNFYMVDEVKIYRLICRLIRKNKPRISKTKKLSMMLDQEMYSYKKDNILILSNTKGKRLSFKVNTSERFTGNLRVNIEDDRIVFSSMIETKQKTLDFTQQRIGIDKNFINCFDTDTEHSYGEGFNGKIIVLSDKLLDKNKKRNGYHEIINIINKKPVLTEKDKKKKQNIQKFNLGKKKYIRTKNKLQEETRKHVNSALNKLIVAEKPREIVVEKLNFTGQKKYKKKTNRYLSTWTKGLMQERIDYKCNENNIKVIEINAAYTSQECPFCHAEGHKQNDIFYCSDACCVASKGVHSGHCSAKVILSRSHDSDVLLNMKPYQVERILAKKYGWKNKNSKIKPIQPRPSSNT